MLKIQCPIQDFNLRVDILIEYENFAKHFLRGNNFQQFCLCMLFYVKHMRTLKNIHPCSFGFTLQKYKLYNQLFKGNIKLFESSFF